MFWESAYTSSAAFDELLASPDVTLSDLLDKEEIWTECKSQNKNLVLFLTRKETIGKLVDLITVEPPVDVPDAIRFKHSNIACEILTGDIIALQEGLCETDMLEKLCAFLDREPPLNPLLTSFFTKTFSMFFEKKSEQDWFSYQSVCVRVLEFIKKHNDFLNSIYKHMATPVIMDLLFNIINNVESLNQKKDILYWFSEQRLIQNLITMLGSSPDSDKHMNIAQFICDVIDTGRTMVMGDHQKHGSKMNGITDQLMRELETDTKIHNQLLDLVFVAEPLESSVVSVIKILLKLLENPYLNCRDDLATTIQLEMDGHKAMCARLLNTISPRLKDFHNLLLNPPEKPDIQTTVALLSPPFGNVRLQICTMFTVFLETENPDIIKLICEIEYFNTLLNLFKQYCWNNILHNQVKKCIIYALGAFDIDIEQIDNNKHMIPSALQKHIIGDCNITRRFIELWLHNSEAQSKPNGCRFGYMGHLIDMIESLIASINVSEEFGALVVASITDDQLTDWSAIRLESDGQVKLQKRFLADIDPAENPYGNEDFQTVDQFDTDYIPNADLNADSQFPLDSFEKTCARRSNADLSQIYRNFNDDFNVFDDMIEGNGIALNPIARDLLIFSNAQMDNTNWNTIPPDGGFADFDSHFDAFQNSFVKSEPNNSTGPFNPFTDDPFSIDFDGKPELPVNVDRLLNDDDENNKFSDDEKPSTNKIVDGETDIDSRTTDEMDSKNNRTRDADNDPIKMVEKNGTLDILHNNNVAQLDNLKLSTNGPIVEGNSAAEQLEIKTDKLSLSEDNIITKPVSLLPIATDNCENAPA